MNHPQDRSKKALGRGLESLLGTGAAPARTPAPPESAGGELLIALDRIRPNPQQPRQRFGNEALAELVNSIRAQGVLQPVLVRRLASAPGVPATYELVAGERRWRAAQLAGLATIPAVVRAIPDAKLLEVALIENLQREDLNPIEQARAYQQLANRFHLTQEEIAQQTGKDRATISNSLRLLKLDAEVQAALESGALLMGQARPLVSLDPATQRRLAAEIVSKGLSARQVEQRLSQLQAPPSAKPAKPVDANLADAEQQLAHALGARVKIRADRRHRGTITIAFAALDDFQRIYERLVPR